MIFKTCTLRPTRAASGKVLGALRLPLTMYADSRADVYCVIWGVSYFVAWNFWRSSTRNPLVTPLVLRVLGKKKKKSRDLFVGAGWRHMSRRGMRTPFPQWLQHAWSLWGHWAVYVGHSVYVRLAILAVFILWFCLDLIVLQCPDTVQTELAHSRQQS